MKKLILSASLLVFTSYSGQELSDEQKKMLRYDDVSDFSTIVNKENIDRCYQNENNSYSFLALSIKLNSRKVFQKLIDEKASLEKVCDEKTPLMFAAKYGNTDLAKKLLDYGAKKEIKTDRGYSALDYAKKYEKTEVAKLLE
nr:ankyrin repeat domain-containing protein [uncultured Chryseobacterium sp.]